MDDLEDLFMTLAGVVAAGALTTTALLSTCAKEPAKRPAAKTEASAEKKSLMAAPEPKSAATAPSVPAAPASSAAPAAPASGVKAKDKTLSSAAKKKNANGEDDDNEYVENTNGEGSMIEVKRLDDKVVYLKNGKIIKVETTDASTVNSAPDLVKT